MPKATSIKVPSEDEDADELEETAEEVSEEEDEEPRVKKQPQKKVNQEVWDVQDIPTQTTPMIVNRLEGKAYTNEIVLAKILNKLERIEKSILE